MKRFAPLALVVLALAGVPAAFADDGASQTAHPAARMHVEILRLRLQLAHLRYRIVCRDAQSDACTAFTQKLVDRLTAIDGKVQDKLDALQCSADSTDKRCTVLGKLDERIRTILSKLGSGGGGGSDESGLDGAAASVTP